ncbi:FdhF/YdeP family oxidoreductase [Rubellimicrobium aerolatum]|uniref:FdhF/YdeP family oxidoreductase n=1 Tax=Rubellimicrobium aerolatum TaxID=490979 RepID=A0ABW0SF03_9RHOB|nr:FdhF/YdeP family oxidoreductase [Rubellimicrobium aerolatum]MBP1807076.1 molybdopterin-dependent oxidoreductase alpha subunit [Rubellimicrobium aerolatum]
MADRADEQREDTPYYREGAGGWGSVEGMAKVLLGETPSAGVLDTLRVQNKPGGHMCTSCAWTKPKDPHPFEFCENGAKATIWDLTTARCGPDFFAKHTVTELLDWTDHDLEAEGRLTHPLRFNPATDRYEETTWDEAFAAIGAGLRALDPKSTVFYTSGRASLETSYLWQLFARAYGHNNLPDSSNMCHETTSVGLKRVIGSSVGTCVLEDFDQCDMILFFGQNTGTNSPRFLHPLQQAAQRGCRIVTFNPIREAGLVKFRNPQNPVQMALGTATQISETYLQVRPGGDIAALIGLIKRVLELEDEDGGILDHAFLREHTQGLDDLRAFARQTTWAQIESASGLTRAQLVPVAEAYARARAVIGVYGMGLTQHVHGSHSIAMLVNLLLLRGNIGRPGTGISPVRGHSNVQGQRTVGITEKPELAPIEQLRTMFGLNPPKETGHTTVEVAQGLLDGTVRAFLSLGGNFAHAISDTARVQPAWRDLALNVQIATKLNRSHLLTCENQWLLPCLVRAEEDIQATGPQAVSMEDSLSHIHGSLGRRTPASGMLRSEPAIVAGIAKATLDPNPRLLWDDWVGDYSKVRDLIEQTWPDTFGDFNARLTTPGGFYRGNAARDRQWKTESGRAEITVPPALTSLIGELGSGEYTLVTLRSNDQFNTTVYGYSDRLRGLKTDRMIVLMNPEEIARAGLREGQEVRLVCAHDDGHRREVAGLKVTAYDLPDRCLAAYYPEANPLVPVSLHDGLSKTPAYKGTPVRIEA